MATLGNNVKTAFLKGLEALGKSASNMASSAHHRLNEINLETRRRELLSEIPVRALDLWQQGEPMPAQLGDMLCELSELDEQLTVLRAQRYARVEAEGGEVAAETFPAEEDSEAALPCDEADEEERPVLREGDVPPNDTPVVPDPIDEGETGDNA